MVKLVHLAMENIAILGFLGFLLITVPAMGIMAIHEHDPGIKTKD